MIFDFLVLAAIELVSPGNDQVVALVPESQRAMLTNRTLSARMAALKADSKSGRSNKPPSRESDVGTFVTEDLAPRWIMLEGRTGNFRDLGGRIGMGGKRVRQGMVYRSRGLNDNSFDGIRKGCNRLAVEDVEYLTKTLGIRTDLDLRSGGPAGCAAAIAARRSGLDVLLVEAQSRLGGTATSGGVSHWLGGRNDAGEWVVGGIFRELGLRAEKEGAAILPKHPEGKTYQPYAWLPWFIHGVVLDSDRIALMLDSVMEEEGVDVLFETCAVGAEKSADRITHVITHSKDGFRRIPAKVVIDATGDADVAKFRGMPRLRGARRRPPDDAGVAYVPSFACRRQGALGRDRADA